MNLGRDEALRVLEGWRADRVRLFCEVRSVFGVFRKVGRLVTITASGAVFRSDGGNEREEDFIFDLVDVIFVRTRPPRELRELAEYARTIFQIRTAQSEADIIVLAELLPNKHTVPKGGKRPVTSLKVPRR